MNSHILNVTAPVMYDDAISSSEYHTYLPYVSASFTPNSEVRIPLQNQDAYTFPAKSYLHIEGRVQRPKKAEGAKATDPEPPVTQTLEFTNNGVAHLFSEIRYELNGVVIDQTRNPGITTTLKGLVSFPEPENKLLTTSGWNTYSTIHRPTGAFSAAIPLSHLLGFAEDHKKLMINIRQELVLIMSNTQNNAFKADESDKAYFSMSIDKIYWRVPHITVSDSERLQLLNVLQNDPWLPVGFVHWELHELPILNKTTHHTWTIKTAPRFETPRYAILAFQTDRKNDLLKDAGKFDHLNLRNAKLYLNGVPYPYDDLNINIGWDYTQKIYQMYAHFQSSYYGVEDRPLIGTKEFIKDYFMVVIDCSKQNETLKTGSVDVRLEWETRLNVPDKTTAYCLLLHDRVVTYKPLTSAVQIIQ